MPRITVLQLDPAAPPDRFEGWLTGAGAEIRLVDVPTDGVPALDDLGDGLLVLGGRMSAHDVEAHPWLDSLSSLMVGCVESDVPVLGVCLGHQVLAQALGGAVTVGDPGGGELGPTELTWSDAAASDPLLNEAARAGRFQPEFHRDAVTALPEGATPLAASALYANQAFRFGSAVGVQFHPEASPQLVEKWGSEGGADPTPLVRASLAVDAEVQAVGRAVAEGFVRVCG